MAPSWPSPVTGAPNRLPYKCEGWHRGQHQQCTVDVSYRKTYHYLLYII